jgi:hypothetical protein
MTVQCIICYLIYTKDKGLILHPAKNSSLDMYVDADFAGMWHQEHSTLRDNILSHTTFSPSVVAQSTN